MYYIQSKSLDAIPHAIARAQCEHTTKMHGTNERVCAEADVSV